jgi:hypothetical protein
MSCTYNGDKPVKKKSIAKKILIISITGITTVLAVLITMNICFNITDSKRFKYTTLEDGTIEVTEFYGKGSVLYMPKKIDGKTITSIGERTFKDSTQLERIYIPKTVTKIAEWGFSYLENLTKIKIPDGVTEIGYSAFIYCDKLAEIEISKSVTEIGNDAFSCDGLTSIIVDRDNPNFASRDGVLFDKNFTKLILCPQKRDGKYIIPDTVTEVDEQAFSGCSLLTEITIPDSVTKIGKGAFAGCMGITEITIPENVTEIGDMAFISCEKLKKINLSNGITKILMYTFFHCKSLTEITIPESVTEIGNGIFRDCSKLTSIVVDTDNPNFVASDGALFDKNRTKILAFAGGIGGRYVIPDSITEVGESAFVDCDLLTEITISENVTKIGKGAFDSCDSITNMVVPKSVNAIGSMAFRDCSKLVSVEILGDVSAIGSQMFSNCKALTEVVLQIGRAHV